MSAVQGWFESVCNCNISKFQQNSTSVTCLDNTTANITTVFQSDDNNTAQAMIDKIYMQGQNHAIVYLQSGWAVCLNADCEWKLDNTTVVDNSTTAMGESDDNNFIPQIVGLVVGILLCFIIGSFLCIFVIVRRMNKKSRLAKEHSYVVFRSTNI